MHSSTETDRSPASPRTASAQQVATVALTALAPASWGTTYAVTTELLPPGHPLFAGLMRALPAGLLGLALTRVLPRGDWWWKAAVLGALNIGALFPLLFLAAERLPGGVAATLSATQPLLVAGLAIVVLHDRPTVWRWMWGVIGVVGVGLVVLGPEARLDGIGVLAGLGGTAAMAGGVVLTKRWGRPEAVGPLTMAGWQLTAGGVLLLPLTFVIEGVPQRIDAGAVGGYLWLGSMGGLIAYTVWFRGIGRLPVGASAPLVLLSPLVATLVGIALGESLSLPQTLGFVLALAALLAAQLNSPNDRRRKHTMRTGMTIAVLGATGMVGSRVITEAGARGHQVLALSRKPTNEHPNVTPIAVDATDASAVHEALAGSASTETGPSVSQAAWNGALQEASSGSRPSSSQAASARAPRNAAQAASSGAVDAVVLAVRTDPVDQDFLVGVTGTVLDIAARLGIRVLVVGGAGALRSPGDQELLVADNPAYVPAGLRPIAAAGIAQLRTCQNHPDADWVYLGPPALLEPGERTGRYRRGTDTLLTGPDGQSRISAEDLAVAVVDELETPGPERLITVAHHDERRDPKAPPPPREASAQGHTRQYG
jgi:drug/metabolite transporter (DMT)-like permease/putative NADH-flavin reductase